MNIKKLEKAIVEAKSRKHTEIAIIGSEIWSRKDEAERYWELLN